MGGPNPLAESGGELADFGGVFGNSGVQEIQRTGRLVVLLIGGGNVFPPDFEGDFVVGKGDFDRLAGVHQPRFQRIAPIIEVFLLPFRTNLLLEESFVEENTDAAEVGSASERANSALI